MRTLAFVDRRIIVRLLQGAQVRRARTLMAVVTGSRETCSAEAVSIRTDGSTAVRSQFGFKVVSLWNQPFTAVANSAIEPPNRLPFSDFGKIRNVTPDGLPTTSLNAAALAGDIRESANTLEGPFLLKTDTEVD